jgi:protein-glutamine gamma-glutamyltransferase
MINPLSATEASRVATRPHFNALSTFFQTLIYVLTALGFTTLALAAQISPAIFLVFVLFYVLAFHRGFSANMHLSPRMGHWLTWAYVPVFILDTFVFSRSFVPATIHLILFVQLIKMYQSKQDRDYFYLLILSFLQVLVASSLTVDFSFLVLFAAYVFVCLSALITFEMKRSSEKAWLDAKEASSKPDWDKGVGSGYGVKSGSESASIFSTAQSRRAIPSICAISALSLFSVLLLGAGLFFAIPRFGSGYFHRMAQRSSNLSGFSETIRLGGIGIIQLDPAVVMRVRVTGKPTFLNRTKWRGVTLDYFDGRTWSKRAKGRMVNYPSGRDFQLNPDSSSGTRVNYQVFLEPSPTGFLFTLDQIIRVQGHLAPLTKDPADDAVIARPHPYRRLTYHAESLLPEARQFQGAYLELLPAEQQAYLQLPSLDPRIFEIAMRISGKASSVEEKARSIERYLQTNFSYSLDQSRLQNPQPLTSFLLETKEGHCEYFASSMVVLLRTLRIPARIVNGFQGGEYNDIGGDYIIRGRDAHSWVEVCIPPQGWLAFDPTPSSPGKLPQNSLFMTFNNYLDAFELFWAEWVVGYDDVIQISMFRNLHDKTAHLTRTGQQGLYEGMCKLRNCIRLLGGVFHSQDSMGGGLLVPVIVALAAILLFIGSRHTRRSYAIKHSSPARRNSLAVKFYEECLAFLEAKGKCKPRNLTPSEYAAKLGVEEIATPVRELTSIYNFARFGKEPVQASQLQRAHELLRTIKSTCRR